MDWQNVNTKEFLNACREDEIGRLKPLVDFFSKFGRPIRIKQIPSRLKCNLYYYRLNYVLVGVILNTIFFITRPLGILSGLIWAFGVLCMNDPFAISVNEVVLRVLRKVSPRLASRARAKAGSESIMSSYNGGMMASGSHRRKKAHYIAFLAQESFCMWCMGLSIAFFILIGGLKKAFIIFLLALTISAGHALMRPPNLRSRINNNRQEFRNVWRDYQQGVLNEHYS
mmetsp:Transcript_22429/g.39796  ORF Transcript_22429/g.39796 Transcript_22429/m.39796 type:complete len:227 (+) Transcript_22429:40-720(+)